MKTLVRQAARRFSGELTACTLLAVFLCSACRTESERETGSSGKASSEQAAPAPTSASQPAAEPAPEVVTLLELNESAYRANVKFADDGIYVLTETAAYRLEPGKDPVRMPLALGAGPALTSTSIVFWSKGLVFAAPKQGGDTRVLAKVARQPQVFTASEDRFAWLDRDDSGKYTIQTLSGEKPRVVYAAQGSIAAIALDHGTAFFVEVAADSSWRVGAISLDGGTPVFTQPHDGRSPSMLYARGDVFYYDGPRRSVLRLSPDLSREEVMADKFICSPITVSDRVVCAQVGAIFEIPVDNHVAPQRVLANPGFVTSIAANTTSVVWLTDRGKSGEDKLALRMVSFAKPGEAPKH